MDCSKYAKELGIVSEAVCVGDQREFIQNGGFGSSPGDSHAANSSICKSRLLRAFVVGQLCNVLLLYSWVRRVMMRQQIRSSAGRSHGATAGGSLGENLCGCYDGPIVEVFAPEG